jgi:branched-chain amino acid transport system ATP-binding protein
VALLEVRDLAVRYGNVEAVRGITFSVQEGEISTLIGSNGAGKSSTLLALSGLVRPSSGSILFQGQNIVAWKTDRIVRAGLVQVAEGRAILSPLTVGENLELGAWVRRDRAGIRADLDKVYGLFSRLADRRKQVAGTLSGGEQQMLAIGRALMGHPRLLLLDEPSMGLAPLLINSVFEIIQTINAEGTTILLVEQNARKALKISHSASVLENGRLVREGRASELLNDPSVARSFLGKGF